MEAREGAGSLQRYQLQAIIAGMLVDPRRGLASRADRHLGQTVRFVDFRDGQVRSGKAIAFKHLATHPGHRALTRHEADLEDPGNWRVAFHRLRHVLVI